MFKGLHTDVFIRLMIQQVLALLPLLTQLAPTHGGWTALLQKLNANPLVSSVSTVAIGSAVSIPFSSVSCYFSSVFTGNMYICGVK